MLKLVKSILNIEVLQMNASTLIKFMIGVLPVAPITSEFIDSNVEVTSSQPDEAYADYEGPTMEEEIQSHSGSIPAIKGIDSVNVQTGTAFDPLAGVYAVDNQDGNITSNIEISNNNVNIDAPGNYLVSYRVENSRGGFYTYDRPVTVSEATSDPIPLIPPTEAQLSGESESSESSDTSSSNTVTFTGVEDTTISVGSDFEPKEDVSAIDVDGTDISNTLYISGAVDTNTPGEYTIAYAVFDSFGDPTAVARTITVE